MSTTPTAWLEWADQENQSVTYPRAYVETAVAMGVDRAQLLATARIDEARLDDPTGRMSLQELWRISHAALSLTNDASLGFAAGLRMPLTAHGNLGYAIMCAATPRQAIDVLQRFWHLRGRGASLQVEETNTTLLLELVYEFALIDVARDLFTSATLTSMYQCFTFLVPHLPETIELWLPGKRPANFDQYQHALPKACFNKPRAGIFMQGNLGLLDQPLPNANPEALAQALALCERESALMDRRDDTLQRTRMALVLKQAGYPSLIELAQQLHLTPRTLRRHLQERGYNYQQLLEDARRRDSGTLLADPKMEIQKIAELLGYTDPANFTRAFKSWFGVTPSIWRQQQAADPLA